jgi:hypothetical protein
MDIPIEYPSRSIHVLRRYGNTMENSPSIHELVTDTVHAPDVQGIGRIILDLFPDVRDVAVHGAVGYRKIIHPPNDIQEFISGNDLPLFCDHKLEDFELEWC